MVTNDFLNGFIKQASLWSDFLKLPKEDQKRILSIPSERNRLSNDLITHWQKNVVETAKQPTVPEGKAGLLFGLGGGVIGGLTGLGLGLAKQFPTGKAIKTGLLAGGAIGGLLGLSSASKYNKPANDAKKIAVLPRQQMLEMGNSAAQNYLSEHERGLHGTESQV